MQAFLLVGETGFEPATARPPASPGGLFIPGLGFLEPSCLCRLGPSCAQFGPQIGPQSPECAYVVWPPSTTMACPRTKEAASEHSQTTAAAISSGVPIRPIGSWRDHLCAAFGGAAGEALHHRGVDDAGADGVDADVRCRVVERGRLGQADDAVLGGDVGGAAGEALDAGARGGVDDRAAALSSISGISCFMHRNTPRRLMAMMRSHSSSVISAVGLVACLDAGVVEGDVEAPERLDRRLAARPSTSSDRVTSHLTASARPPVCSIIRAVSWLPSSAMSATTTLAPSRAKASAVARPMPLAAPVTNATLPVRSRGHGCRRTLIASR